MFQNTFLVNLQITTSGYGTESHGIGRSDTLESVASSHKEPENSRRDIFDDDDDDDLFKSARIEPEPRHVNGFGSETSAPPPDREISLDDDEDEEPPFKVNFRPPGVCFIKGYGQI